jgi:hypothetical protein
MYKTLYNTLNARYAAAMVFIVPISACQLSTLPRLLNYFPYPVRLHLRASTPTKFPASTAPTKNGAFSMLF